MTELIGKTVSEGIAIGKICLLKDPALDVPEYEVEDTEKELLRYRASRDLAKEKLQKIHDSALKRVTKKESVIFQTHMMILEDSKFVDLVEAQISEGKNAEYAVFCAGEKLAKLFKGLDDEYFKARYTDIIDASNVLLEILLKRDRRKDVLSNGEPVIIAADDIMPSDAISINKDSILGFATNNGSVNSHASIIARTMSLPSLIQLHDLPDDCDGKTAIIDGQGGRFIIDPDINTLALYSAKRERYNKQQQRLMRQLGLRSETKNGVYIRLTADIGRLDLLDSARNNDAEGIGLYRSEFLFTNRDKCPDESEQYETYKTIIKAFEGKPVVINTANVCSGRGVKYLDIPTEKNPSMGFRGIRISLENREFLRTQLAALLRAGAGTGLSILLPMITSVEEIDYVRREIESVKNRLQLSGEQYCDDLRLGVMIETPAAAIMTDVISANVDFLTIDTDMLVQYTLAMDKDNPKLEDFYRPHHPAIRRLLTYSIKAARRNKVHVSVCGGLAGDTAMTKFFIDLGVSELILPPSKILSIKALVRETQAEIVDADDIGNDI